MIRIDAVWLAVTPMDMRAGTDTALARVVAVAYSGDRDRLRSVQELRCANCILELAHHAKAGLVLAAWCFKWEFKKSGGGATGRSPQGRGRPLHRASVARQAQGICRGAVGN